MIETTNTFLLKQQQKHLSEQNIAWVNNLRSKALQQFNAQGFPTTRDERWKYTNINLITQREFQIAPEAILTPEQIQSFILSDNVAVIINGRYDQALSSLSMLPNNIIISSLAQQIQQNNLLLARYMNTYQPDDAFSALNTAFLQDGLFIHIPNNIKLTKPLQLLFIATDNAWVQPRNVICLDENSQAIIIESFYSLSSSITNIITDIHVDKNAKLEYIKLQREHDQAFHIGRTQINLAANSVCDAHAFSTGALLGRSDVNIVFSGERAECSLYGLYMTKGRQHLDQHTIVDHAVPNCKSQEFYRGILADKSRAVFNGKVIVRPNARHTEATQANHNLLLSSDAEIDTKPELEIYHDDVKCTHGATIGQLDNQALFYLQSRGINQDDAKHLLIYAFAQKILDKLSNETLKTKLNEYLREMQ